MMGDGGELVKSFVPNYYLHVSSGRASSGEPVYHTDSTTDGSMWRVEDVGDPSSRIIRMKNVRGFYLHVKSEKMEDGDPVFHVDSTSEGSEWEMEVVEVEEGYGAAFMLKSVRSGFYLYASDKSRKTCCDEVYHKSLAEPGDAHAMWQIGSEPMTPLDFEEPTPAPAPTLPTPPRPPTPLEEPTPAPKPTLLDEPTPAPPPTLLTPPPALPIIEDVAAGDIELPVDSLVGESGGSILRGLPGDIGPAPWFEVGDSILIEGGGKSETGVIASLGSIVLTTGLKSDYPAGSDVTLIEPTPGDGSDNDGDTSVLSMCTANGESCASSRCCSEPGMTCYKKNDHWSSCNETCNAKSLWTADGWVETDEQVWDCEELRPPCSESGASCAITKCCADPGMQCYKKDEHWSSCNATCNPNSMWTEDGWVETNDSVWSCEDIGGP
jgi:hypothetical protein